MKSELLYALIGGGLVALAWLATAFSVAISFEQVIGYGAVVVLLSMFLSTYGIRLGKYFR